MSLKPSANDPVSDVVIAGHLANNGAGSAGAGAGIYIDAHQVTASEKISDITIDGVNFDNNTNAAVKTLGPSNVANLSIGSANTYSGPNQTTGLDAGTLTANQ